MSKPSKKALRKQQNELYRKASLESKDGIKHNRSFLKTLVILFVVALLAVLISIYNARSYYQDVSNHLEQQVHSSK